MLQAGKNAKSQNLSLIFEDAAAEFEACLKSAQRLGPVSPITGCAICVETARRILSPEDFYFYCSTIDKLVKNCANRLPWYLWIKAMLQAKLRRNNKPIIGDIDAYLTSVIRELGHSQGLCSNAGGLD